MRLSVGLGSTLSTDFFLSFGFSIHLSCNYVMEHVCCHHRALFIVSWRLLSSALDLSRVGRNAFCTDKISESSKLLGV